MEGGFLASELQPPALANWRYSPWDGHCILLKLLLISTAWPANRFQCQSPCVQSMFHCLLLLARCVLTGSSTSDNMVPYLSLDIEVPAPYLSLDIEVPAPYLSLDIEVPASRCVRMSHPDKMDVHRPHLEMGIFC